jgi:hypothetical protein
MAPTENLKWHQNKHRQTNAAESKVKPARPKLIQSKVGTTQDVSGTEAVN